jgi:hypothetical protein
MTPEVPARDDGPSGSSSGDRSSERPIMPCSGGGLTPYPPSDRVALVAARRALGRAVANLCTAHVLLIGIRASSPDDRRAVRALLMRRYTMRSDARRCEQLATDIADVARQFASRCRVANRRPAASEPHSAAARAE